MNWPNRAPAATVSLPLGIDLRSATLGIVAASARPGTVYIDRVAAVSVTDDLNIARLLAELGIPERRCVAALRADQAEIAAIPLPAKMPHDERLPAAELLADEIAPIDKPARIVRLADTMSGGHALVVTKRADRDMLCAQLKDHGLTPVTIDLCAPAWLRIAPEGVLDDDPRSPYVALRLRGVPHTARLPARITLDPFTSAAINAISDLRQTATTPITRLHYFGQSRERYEHIAKAFTSIGLTLDPITIDTHVCPPWAFAYALCTWSHRP